MNHILLVEDDLSLINGLSFAIKNKDMTYILLAQVVRQMQCWKM